MKNENTWGAYATDERHQYSDSECTVNLKQNRGKEILTEAHCRGTVELWTQNLKNSWDKNLNNW